MRRHCFALVLTLIGCVAFASAAAAGEPFGKLAPYWRTPTPYYVGNPRVIVPLAEAHPRTAQFARKQSIAPHAYPYGYFGARTLPYSYRSFGYYEGAVQTTYGRGF